MNFPVIPVFGSLAEDPTFHFLHEFSRYLSVILFAMAVFLFILAQLANERDWAKAGVILLALAVASTVLGAYFWAPAITVAIIVLAAVATLGFLKVFRT